MTAILTDARERGRFLRFAVVGIIGAIVDFGVANLLVYAFHVQLVAAGTTSFICAVISNFLWNRYWTYPDSRSKSLWKQFVQFTAISVMGLAIRVPVLHYLEPVLLRLFKGLPFSLSFLRPDFLAKNTTLAIAVIIVMFWNFFVNRYVTYNDVK
ncbi:MAG: GtrA family protein [Chloroflexota bacterium]